MAAEHVAILDPADQLIANIGPVEQAGGEIEQAARPVAPILPVLFHHARLPALHGLANGVGQVAVLEIEEDALHRGEGRKDFARGGDVAGHHGLAERQRVHHRQAKALIIRGEDDDAAGGENLVHFDVGNDAGVKLSHVGRHVVAALAHDEDRQAGDGFAQDAGGRVGSLVREMIAQNQHMVAAQLQPFIARSIGRGAGGQQAGMDLRAEPTREAMPECLFGKLADEEEPVGVAGDIGPERLHVIVRAQIAAVERDDVEHAVYIDRGEMLHDADLVEVEGLAEEDGHGIARRHIGAQPNLVQPVDAVKFRDGPLADDMQFEPAGRLAVEPADEVHDEFVGAIVMMADAQKVEGDLQPAVDRGYQVRHLRDRAIFGRCFMRPDQRQKFGMARVDHAQIGLLLALIVDVVQLEGRRTGMIGEGVIGEHGAKAHLARAHDEVIFLLIADAEIFIEIAEIGDDLRGNEQIKANGGRREAVAGEVAMHRFPGDVADFRRGRDARKIMRRGREGRQRSIVRAWADEADLRIGLQHGQHFRQGARIGQRVAVDEQGRMPIPPRHRQPLIDAAHEAEIFGIADMDVDQAVGLTLAQIGVDRFVIGRIVDRDQAGIVIAYLSEILDERVQAGPDHVDVSINGKNDIERHRWSCAACLAMKDQPASAARATRGRHQS